MIEGKVLILSSEDVDSHKAFEKVTDFKAEAYANLAHFDVVLLVEKDRTVIVKNRYGPTSQDEMENKMERKIRKDNKLVLRADEIENQISKLCTDFSEYLGFHVGWSDVRELAEGISIASIRNKN